MISAGIAERLPAAKQPLPGEGRAPRPGARPRPRRRLLSWAAAIALGFAAMAPANAADPWPGARPAAVLPAQDDILLDELQRSAFRFFQEQADPRTGLVRDRARADGSKSDGKASIAASGFALSAWAVAAQRGWVSRDRKSVV